MEITELSEISRLYINAGIGSLNICFYVEKRKPKTYIFIFHINPLIQVILYLFFQLGLSLWVHIPDLLIYHLKPRKHVITIRTRTDDIQLLFHQIH